MINTSHLIRLLIVVFPLFLLNGARPMPHGEEVIKTTCDEFNARAKLLKNGMTEHEVIKILGTPHKKNGDMWLYYGYTGQRLPRVGEQYFYDATLVFENGRVKDIRHSWIDATGPDPKINRKRF